MVEEEMSKSHVSCAPATTGAIRREARRERSEDDELDDLRERLSRGASTARADKAGRRELSRMRLYELGRAEYQSRTIREWLCDLPWHRPDARSVEVSEVRRVLDEDHRLWKSRRSASSSTCGPQAEEQQKSPILCFHRPSGCR